MTCGRTRGELFEVDAAERGLIEQGIAVDPESLRAVWSKTVRDVLGRGDARRSPIPAGCRAAGAAAATASTSAIC